MRLARVTGKVRVVQGVIAAASIVLAVVGVASSSVPLQRLAGGISAYVLAAALVYVLWVTLRQQHVTGDTLFGALAAYLAMAVVFAMVYTLIARTDPGAFDPPQPVVDGQTDLYDFSFVAITSLGYGDIAPVSDLTRVLAPIEAVVGAILIAALVGRIVGLLVAQQSSVVTQQRLDAVVEAIERLDRPEPGSAGEMGDDSARETSMSPTIVSAIAETYILAMRMLSIHFGCGEPKFEIDVTDVEGGGDEPTTG